MADAVRSSQFVVKQSLKNTTYQNGSSAKMLINEMRNRQKTKFGGPNVVAQLMGMDTLPTIDAKEYFHENLRRQIPNISHCEITKVDLSSLPSTAKKLPSNRKQQYSIPSQEDQLHKFKKEFEAWQESKLWEFSSGEGLNNEQILALENLNKEKMAVNTNTYLIQKKPVDTDDYVSVSKIKITQNQLYGFQNDGNFQEKRSIPCSPTRIVILKPSSDIIDEMEAPWSSSPEVVEKGSSMEDFLEEVKQRLRLEMEGKGRNDFLHESPTADPKQLAREAAKHGAVLRRSQSMITYRNAFRFDGRDCSKFIKRETREFISERLKNVLRDDAEMKKPVLDDGSDGESLSVQEMAKKMPFGDEVMPPSNLFRSFSVSASTSRSAFEKSLLEYHRVATEAENFQEHEASSNNSAVVKKGKKYGFSIKNTVLNLKTKFFRKKVPLMGESAVDTVRYAKPDETMPSVIRNFDFVQDNSTEVPPSPASFPCSPLNEHRSPVSPLEDPFVDDDRSSTQVSGELSMTLTEFESKRCEMATQIQLCETNETILIEGCGEAYVRAILVVSGLYRASWPLDEAISWLDGQIKPISSCIFDEVEEKCRKLRNVDDDFSTVSLGDTDIDRKLLFDLVNEVLPSVLYPMTQLMSEGSGRSLLQFPHGRKLLDGLLNQIHICANPKVEHPQSIDKIVAWDLKLRPWLAESHEEISSFCGEVEWVIIRELIDDLLSDLLV